VSAALESLTFVGSLAVTLFAAAVFAERLDLLGERIGLPEALVGLLTAAGADAPELSAAVTALLTGAKGAGLGVVIGSNVFNLGAMIGASAIAAGAVTLRREALVVEGGVALGVTGAVCLLGFGVVPAWAALALTLALLAPYVAVIALAETHTLSWRRRRVFRHALGRHHHRGRPRGRELWQPLLTIPPAVGVIVLGSIGMVHSSLSLAGRVGLPQVLVGVLLLAVLTSLPNAYTGVRLGRAGRGAALVSETANSNTINLVGGVAVPALFVGLGARFSTLLTVDVVWLFAATAVTIALLWRPAGIGRRGGGLLVLSWLGFAVVQGIFG
jgi:cation:H+ antiporter